MSSIAEIMTHDHRRCDDIYAKAEEAIAAGDFELASLLWREFC